MTEPSYQELGPTEFVSPSFWRPELIFPINRIPTAYPQGKDGPVRIKVISGSSHGVESPVRPLGG